MSLKQIIEAEMERNPTPTRKTIWNGFAPSYCPREECNLDGILVNVANMTPSHDKKSLFMGFGGRFNLDVVAAGNFDGAILADINEKQPLFWDILFDITKECNNRETVLSQSTQYEEDDLDNPDTWVGSDEKFGKVKEMVDADNIVTLLMDAVYDDEKMAQLSQIIEKEGYAIDVLYLTNILHYTEEGLMDSIEGSVLDYVEAELMGTGFCPQEMVNRFWKNIGLLVHEDTRIIHAVSPQHAIAGEFHMVVGSYNELRKAGAHDHEYHYCPLPNSKSSPSQKASYISETANYHDKTISPELDK